MPSDLGPHATFRALKKAEKAKRLEALFHDLSVREALGLSREQNARIDAWLPAELTFAAPAEDDDIEIEIDLDDAEDDHTNLDGDYHAEDA